MNELRDILRKEAYRLEQEKKKLVESDPWRLQFHLMPPVGWMNDPNGLCQFQGKYHVFFQYTPYDAQGGLKVWGHYSSSDWIHWDYHGIPLLPDCPYDVSGVYSGSALVDDETMYLYFTGNVKYDGDYDYINNGREGNTVLVESKDGYTIGDKCCVLKQEDYPKDYTCHIRDPKVFRYGENYYMVLGGRKKDETGAILLYVSKDKKTWNLEKELRAEGSFGYMWECPDLFSVSGRWICAFSPQGISRESYQFQNIYHSGYVALDEKPFGENEKGNFYSVPVHRFREWDMGFDFYAPQTFEDENGRRILIGWMGISDGDLEYKNPTVEKGWQHALTLPREIIWKDDILYQYPIKEVDALRGEKVIVENGKAEVEKGCFDLLLCGKETEKCQICLAQGLIFFYDVSEISLELSKELGRGRSIRRAKTDGVKQIRILADTSAVEIYVNGGEYVFTTRYYPLEQNVSVQVDWKDAQIQMWEMNGFSW